VFPSRVFVDRDSAAVTLFCAEKDLHVEVNTGVLRSATSLLPYRKPTVHQPIPTLVVSVDKR
jgi:hypothetical protein